MSPNGLRKFLGGGSPHPATRRKLELWVLQDQLRDPGADVGPLVLHYLLQLVPESAHSEAAPQLRELLGVFIEAHGGVRPTWLEPGSGANVREAGGTE